MEMQLQLMDHTGDRSARVTVEAEQTVGQLRPQFLEALSPLGEPTDESDQTYLLYRETPDDAQVLSDTDVVGDVLADRRALVRVVPHIVAGRCPR